MKRQEILNEIEASLGLVPTFFQGLPDATLESEWTLFKGLQLGDGPIPAKYRQLVGVGVSAAIRCDYCALFHTEVARLHGATDEEIEDAVAQAKCSVGWSTYVHGMQIDYEEFKDEVRRVYEYVSSAQAAA